MAKHAYAFVDDGFRDFRSRHIKVRVAKSSWEKQKYFSLRQKVFSKEQKILVNNEQDGKDFRSIPIIALASYCGVSSDIVGAVRIYLVETENKNEQVWFGGRLCVDRSYRGHPSIGKGLINEAVSRAKDLGCTTFLANVQPQNEAYFHSVYWKTIGHIEVSGKPHLRMEADLSYYPFMSRSQQ
jgi:putative N-acetyltransferase (TIGR04045 family)